jgi:coatomer protein complex subunit epsilon
MQLVIDEIGPGAATPLQAVRLLAVYLSGGAGGKVTSCCCFIRACISIWIQLITALYISLCVL